MILKKTRHAVASVLFAVLLVSSSGMTVAAYAANTADTPWHYTVAASSSANTESRAKTNQSRVYFNCESVSGSGVVQPCGKQKGSTYYWGSKYPVNKGLQYLKSMIYENRPENNVTVYCYLRFTNNSSSAKFSSSGLWSPDNSKGIGL